MRCESKPRLEIVMKNMFSMKHSKLLLPTLTLLIAFSALAITTQPVRGANPNILYIGPGHINSGQAVGTSIFFAVKVSNIDPFNAWDIQVAVDPTVLNPTAFTITPNTLTNNFTISELELTHCINGGATAGGTTGCTPPSDTNGVVHSAVFPLGSSPTVASVSGILFNITYAVVNPTGFSTIHLQNTKVVSNGVPIVTTNVDGTYGNPPPHATTTSVTCSSPIVINQASTCRANVTDTSTSPTTPTGTVSFTATGTVTPASAVCNLGAGAVVAMATCVASFTGTASGTASVTGTYGGDSGTPSHTGSTSAAATITVNKRSTSTSITCASPVVINLASICSVTVADTDVGTAIPPTGTVTFTSTGPGSLSAPSCILTSGACTVSFTGTAAGSATVAATYGGDSSHNGSGPTTSNTITVNKRSTSTGVSCAPSSINIGGGSTCTATVTDTDVGTAITPSGTVTFTSSNTAVGTVAASCTLGGTGTCTVTFTGVAPGSATVSGTYGSDATHLGSGPTASNTITVAKDTTTTSIPNPVSCNIASGGTTCTMTVIATVADTTNPSNTPTGTVTFTLTMTAGTGSLSSNTCILSAGSCSVTFTGGLPVPGSGTLTASYGSDGTHLASSSPASTVSVTQTAKDNTATTVSCAPASINIGGTSTCTATVTDTTTPSNIPTGTVTFTSSNTAVGTVAASCTLGASGTCTAAFTGVAPRSATITGTYPSDAPLLGSGPTASNTITVAKDTTTTSIPNPVSCNIPLGGTTCTMTVIATVADTTNPSNTPTGTVTFTLTMTAGTGSLSSNTCILSAGS